MRNKTYLFFLFLWILNTPFIFSQSKVSALELSMQREGLMNINPMIPTIKVDLKYATTDNLTKTILYDGEPRNAYLHQVAANKLVKAQANLKKIHPNYTLLIYDAARPLSVQKKMYQVVQNTPYRAYVADPTRTGLHNYGMAVDLTICNETGIPLDMGTAFDFFGKAAGINREAELVKEGVLTEKQVENRKLLRKVMVDAGFLTIRGEWWHFNAVSLEVARKNYKVIE